MRCPKADAQEATKQSSENEKISAVDQILQQAVERKEVVGVVGCVVQADGVRYLKAFGKGTIEPEEKKTHQIFWIASMSNQSQELHCCNFRIRQDRSG